MRKIYSLVLMATMLLIGTNAWADVHATLVDGVDEAKVIKDGESTWMYATSLKDAFDYVGYGETAEIVLLRSINVEAPITMPGTIPTYANGKGRLHEVDGQNITLNLNGKNITTTTNNVTPFRILKGSLDIEGSGIITKEHTNRYKDNGVEKVYGEPDWYGGAIVAISGAQDSLAADWSVLTIGKDVTLQFNRETGSDGKVLKSKAIAITNFAGLGWAKVASGSKAYNGTTYTQGEGTDFLARKYNALQTETSAVNPINASEQVDKFGYATRATKPTSTYTYSKDNKKYTQAIWQGNEDDFGTVEQIAGKIAANKNILPMGWGALSGTNTFNKNTENETIYYYNILQGCAFGVKVIIEGTVSGSYYGVHFHGNINQTPEGLGETKTRHEAAAPYFTHQFPYLKVGKTATVSSAADGSCNGIYVAGYGVVDIEGEVYGATGVYMKSGDVVCNDANIRSTFTGDAVFNWGTNGDGGTHGSGGSAIVAETSDAYAGCMGVTIQGDTKVTGSTGYAIFDQTTVTTTTEGDVTTYSTTNHVTIEGGTIESGTLGTIAVTQGAVDATSISGGNVEGTTVTISNPDVPGQTVTIPTTDFISEGTHTTTVQDGNKTIVVVSQGAAPTDYDHVQGNAKDSVNWIGTGANATETLNDNLTLKELEINQDWVQTLTIPNGKTLSVGRVVLGVNARIIVEAGGKFIVTGEQGIVAPNVSNILIKTSETAQGIFLFHPEVSSNRHPNATVKLTSKGYVKNGDNNQKVWQRFGVPAYTSKVEEGAVIRYSTNPEDNPVTYNYASWIAAYDYSIDNWVTMPDEDAFVPFQCYEASSVATAANQTVYTFKCPLMGNSDFTLPLNAYTEWNYYANSYMAPIDIEQMLTSFVNNDAKVKGTVYVYRSEDNWWDNINLGQLGYFPTAAQTKIDPMQAFIFQKKAEGTSDAVINYKKHIYNPDPTTTPVAAPARNHEVFSAAIVEIAAADGAKDKLYLIESDKFSADFDNGYDAAKYMNNESFNIFAGEQMGIIATDDLEGTAISMTTKAQTSFTMTFSNVTNMEYAIRDNLTGTETAIEEGATYMFSTAANANVEGRFEIVPVAKMPTSIENIEATAAVKGIYTVSGQFVGNDYHSLPNGIYVVDGKKIVK